MTQILQERELVRSAVARGVHVEFVAVSPEWVAQNPELGENLDHFYNQENRFTEKFVDSIEQLGNFVNELKLEHGAQTVVFHQVDVLVNYSGTIADYGTVDANGYIEFHTYGSPLGRFRFRVEDYESQEQHEPSLLYHWLYSMSKLTGSDYLQPLRKANFAPALGRVMTQAAPAIVVGGEVDSPLMVADVDEPTSTTPTLNEILRTNLATYNSLAAHYEATGHERSKTIEWLAPLFTSVEGMDPPVKLLDVGAADGFLAGALSDRGYVVTALDFAPSMIEAIKRNAPSAKAVHAEFIEHDFRRKRFDVILLVAFVHLFPRDVGVRVIQKAASMLTERGVCLLSTTIDEDRIGGGYERKSGVASGPMRYRYRFSQEEFLGAIRSAGLNIYNVSTYPDPRDNSKVWIDCIAGRSADPDMSRFIRSKSRSSKAS